MVRRRSACSVVDTDDCELQSLVGFGSRSLAPLVGSADAAPPLGALPQHYAIAGRRTADSVRTCSAPWKLSETSLKRVAAAMGCGGCHRAVG